VPQHDIRVGGDQEPIALRRVHDKGKELPQRAWVQIVFELLVGYFLLFYGLIALIVLIFAAIIIYVAWTKH